MGETWKGYAFNMRDEYYSIYAEPLPDHASVWRFAYGNRARYEHVKVVADLDDTVTVQVAGGHLVFPTIDDGMSPAIVSAFNEGRLNGLADE